MEEWIQIALADLNSYLEASLVVKLNSADLAPGQADRFTVAMEDVTNEFRARIGSFPGMVVSATANSVPPELKRHCCQLILLAMQYTCPGIVIEKELRTEFGKNWDVFKEIKKGELRVSNPPDPQAVNQQIYAPATTIRTQHRQATAHKLRGVL